MITIQAPVKITDVSIQALTTDASNLPLLGKRALVTNTGSTVAYISNAAGITTSNGFPIAAGVTLPVLLTGTIYMISGSTGTLSFLILDSY